MQRYESIENGIAQNDIKRLREAIGSICYTSRNFSSGEFDDAVSYVIQKGIALKDEKLVGSLISEGKETYTDEDFTRAVFELKRNFCDERINDVKKIGRSLYKKSEPKVIDSSTANRNKDTGIIPNVQSHREPKAKLLWAAIPVAAVIILIVILTMTCAGGTASSMKETAINILVSLGRM